MSAMQYLEIIGTAVGLVYIWLEYRASKWLWLTGIIMPAIYIFVYRASGLYADMGINIYYLIAGIYGWAIWTFRRGEGEKELPIRHTPHNKTLPLVAVTVVAFALIAWILITFTDSTVPYMDSFTTALSITAMWMLAHKYVEHWWLWIAVDAVSAGLYIYKGLYPTAVLYGLYAVIAVAAYFKWKKMMNDTNATLPTA